MPLSRHFYAIDEVQASLIYSTTRHDPKETLFWCRELIHSGCVAEAIHTLFEAWLWQKGPFCIAWALNAWEHLATDEVTVQHILNSAHQLQHKFLLRDHSLWNLLILTRLTKQQPDRLSCYIPPWLEKKEVYDIDYAFMCAIYQKKARLAWWFAKKISYDRVWELMEEYICNDTQFGDKLIIWRDFCKIHYKNLLGYESDAYAESMQCLFLLTLCMTTTQLKKSMSELDVFDDSDDMEISIGRKEYRQYSIPTHAIYGITERGCMPWSSHTRNQLYQIEKYLIGCPFWEDALSEYIICIHDDTREIEWQSYDSKEEFYDRYFPDSPPDEWTEKDIALSHGPGVLRPGEDITLRRYSQIYFSKLTRLAWNIAPSVYRLLSTITCEHPGFTAFREITVDDNTLSDDQLKIQHTIRRLELMV